MEKKLSCIDCAVKNCDKLDKTYPEFCVTKHLDKEVFDRAMDHYKEEENHEVMVAAAGVESDFYGRYTRVEEIIAFAGRIGAKKIGIATCVGLIKESRTLASILRSHGFEVYGVACKVGTVPKEDAGIPLEYCKIGKHMCNPILQAEVLNDQKTDLNVVMGLCVGHDSLFIKYSEALVTSGVTKDRVLGHNPVAALYTADSYYTRLKK